MTEETEVASDFAYQLSARSFSGDRMVIVLFLCRKRSLPVTTAFDYSDYANWHHE